MTRTTQADAVAKADALAALQAEIDRREADYHLASLPATEALERVRDYIDGTQPLDRIALAEVAFAWLDGYRFGAERYSGPRDADGTRDATRPAFETLRKAGLSL